MNQYSTTNRKYAEYSIIKISECMPNNLSLFDRGSQRQVYVFILCTHTVYISETYQVKLDGLKHIHHYDPRTR